MNEAEAIQMMHMINWSHEQTEVMAMHLKTYKQYQEKEKSYLIKYEVSSTKWVNDCWKRTIGTGSTVLEAMNDYTKKLA